MVCSVNERKRAAARVVILLPWRQRMPHSERIIHIIWRLYVSVTMAENTESESEKILAASMCAKQRKSNFVNIIMSKGWQRREPLYQSNKMGEIVLRTLQVPVVRINLYGGSPYNLAFLQRGP